MSNENAGNKKQQQVTILQNRESVTEQQVAQLTHMLREFRQFLPSTTEDFHGIKPAALEIDKSVKFAIETSIIQVCNRIDALLADGKRWSTEDFDRTFNAILETQKAHANFWTQQAVSAEIVSRPSHRLQPTLAVVEGEYYAFIGDTMTVNAIIGRGKTPSEAYADFDRAFQKAPADQIAVALNGTPPEPPPAPEAAPQPETKKRRKK